MSGFMERAGRFLGRLVRPAYNRSAEAIEGAPYHVKYNAAVVAAFIISIAMWALVSAGVGLIVGRLFGLNAYFCAACFAVIYAIFWRPHIDQSLPDLRRVLRLRLIRKH